MNTYTAKVVIECNGSVVEQEMFYSTDLAELKRLAQCNFGNGKEDILVPDLKCAVRVLKAWMAGQIKIFDQAAMDEQLGKQSKKSSYSCRQRN